MSARQGRNLKPFLTSLLLTWLVLIAIAWLVPGIRFSGGISALFGALALALVNALVRPMVIALTLPLTVFTLGLFLLVINALMLMLAAALVPGFYVDGFVPALLGSLLLSLLNVLIPKAFEV